MSQSPKSKYVLKRDDEQIVTLPNWWPGEDSDEEEEEYPPSPSDHIPFGSLKCECHHLNWGDPLKNGGICDYTYPDGSLHQQLTPHPVYGHTCGDKANLRQVSRAEMLEVCKYNLRSPNCALPRDLQEDLIWFLARSGGGVDYNEKFDENHPNHYKKHYKGVKEMIEESDRKSEEEYQEWFQGWYQKSLQSGTAAPLSETTE
tara:strand:+ start:166 stop:771 length:606 start_codon:yes stop_codon:yes gene_type:complete